MSPQHDMREAIHPYNHAFVITPSNTVPLAQETRAIYVGGAGNLNVTLGDGYGVQFQAVPVGTILPISARYVAATGTTATFLLGLW